MSLATLLKKPSSVEKLASTVAKLTAEHESAKASLEAASDAWADALADEAEAEGGGSEAASAAAEKNLDKAQRAEASARAALGAAQARHKASLIGAENTQIIEAWDKAESLSAARQAKLVTLTEAVKRFADEYNDLIQLTDELRNALPKVDYIDKDGARLNTSSVEISLRKYLARLGFEWACASPFGWSVQPTLLEQFDGITELIRGYRDRALSNVKP